MLINAIANTRALGSPLLTQIATPVLPRTTELIAAKVVGVTLLLLVLSSLAGYAIWLLFPTDAHTARNFGFGAGVLAFSFALIASLKPHLSRFLAPLYAVAGGFFMGGLAFAFEQRFPGIALQTVLVTVCVFVSMLMLYLNGVLRATPRFRLAVYVATAGIAAAYLLAILLSLLGLPLTWLKQGSWGAVLWYGFVALIAALNLVLDFERIDRLRRELQPDYVHWYVARGLMVTLVWLYISILRLIFNVRR